MVYEKEKQSGEFIHRILHLFLKEIENSTWEKESFERIKIEIENSSMTDLHPKTDLHQLVESSQELIESNYHGSSNKKAENYLAFLNFIRPKLPQLRPKVACFIKCLISDMRRNMLK